eukprot:gene4786-6521_t
METASGIWLKPDSSFEFFYSYGAIDRTGTGTWRPDEKDSSRIILNSRPRPAVDFALVKSTHTNDTVTSIQISDKNEMLLSYMHIRAHTPNGIVDNTTDSHGGWTMPKQPVTKIDILFELCPE